MEIKELKITKKELDEYKELKEVFGYKIIKRCSKCFKIYGSDVPNDSGICTRCEVWKHKPRGVYPQVHNNGH